MNRHKMYLVALFAFGPPVYSWKYRSSGTWKTLGSHKTNTECHHPLTLRSLCRKTSILFKNKTMDVLRNHRELITESNRTRDSAIRFWEAHPSREVSIRKHAQTPRTWFFASIKT